MSQFIPLISVNGRLGEKISPLDRGFAYGDGVFETLRVSLKGVLLWEYHLQRLQASCQRLAITLSVAQLVTYRDELLYHARQLGIKNAVMKIIVSRGEGGRGYAAPDTLIPTLCIGLFPLPQYPDDYWDKGITVIVCQQRLSRNSRLAGLKHLNKLEHVLARREWQGDAVAEGLLLDDLDNVIEATASNLFIVSGDELLTPSLDQCGVAGIMRRLVVEILAPTLKLNVKESDLSMAQVLQAKEIFLTSSINGLWPVVCLEEKVFTKGKVTERLQQALKNYLLQWENSLLWGKKG